MISLGRTPALLMLLAMGCRGASDAPSSRAPEQFQGVASPGADSLFEKAQAVYRHSEYDSAVALFEASRSQAAADGDSAAVARAVTWLGLAAMRQGRNDDARRLGEAALAMKLRLGLRNDYSRSYNALGLLAHQQGRLTEAIKLFDNALKTAAAVADSAGVARATGNDGLVRSDFGELDVARERFSYLAQHAPDTTAMANAFSNLGMVESRSGNPAGAIVWLAKARSLYAAIDYPTGEESVLGQLGVAYSTLGETQKAIAYIDSAVAVAREHGLVREEAEDMIVYGELMGDAGDRNSALRHLDRARSLADSAGLASRKGDIARAQARQLAALSRKSDGLAKAREALRIHRAADNKFEELQDLLLVAELDQSLGRTSAAVESLEQAAEIALRLDVPVADELVALGSARVYDLAGDAEQVLRVLPPGARFLRLGPMAAAEAESLRARAQARLRRWPEAAQSGKRAIASLEMVRRNIGEGSLRSAFTSDNSRVYADLVTALLQLGRTDEAFEIADAAKGRSLLEHLTSFASMRRGSVQDISEADRLLRRIDFLTERLRVADTMRTPNRGRVPNPDQQGLLIKLTDARNEYEDRMLRAARTDPRGSALIGAYRMSALEIQKALSEREMLVEYFVAPDRAFMFAVTRDSIHSLVLPTSDENLANQVRLASEYTARAGGQSRADPILKVIYEILVSPVENLPSFRSASTLIVVPHAPLTSLPFAALIDKSSRRLVEKKALLTISSASSLPALRGRIPRTDRRRYTVLAPFPRELRGTLEEARGVIRHTANARMLVGTQATEQQLRSALSEGANVHVASHAVVNQTNPMFSHIELVSGPTGAPYDNGRLDVHELLEIPVRSRLVYLSGCETAAGASWSTAFRRSQDYATLSQAILYAGADNVVATLWRIDDAGASAFAQRFYQALKSVDLIQALALAQRQMMRDPRYSAPRYWAAYTLSGAGFGNSSAQTVKALPVQ